MPKAFLVDTTRCTACRGCQVACKEWHDLPANATKQRGTHQNPPDLNPYNYKIVRFHEHLNAAGDVVWNFFPDQCRHCLTPVCVDVADMAVPGAMVKDAKTGAVLATDKSAGLNAEDARAITEACPYNIPRYDAAAKRITKCDMCIDRVEAGLPPMCVKTCPTGAMVFDERDADPGATAAGRSQGTLPQGASGRCGGRKRHLPAGGRKRTLLRARLLYVERRTRRRVGHIRAPPLPSAKAGSFAF